MYIFLSLALLSFFYFQSFILAFSGFFFLWRCDPTRAMASSFTRFLDHTQRRITVGRTPLDEWSARRRDLYLTTHNTHNRQTPMPPVGFEPTISAGERPQTYALDRAATGTGCFLCWLSQILIFCWCQSVCLSTYSNVPTMYRTLFNITPAKHVSLISPSI